jgi:RNA polymerase sigma-70 factor (ECF subfamily)
MDKKSDQHIIKQVILGDATAFAHIIDKYERMVYTLAVNIVKNKEEAEEVAQDAFYKAYKNLKSFKGEADFSTWLYRIVHNTAISKLRGRKQATADISEIENKMSEHNFFENNIHRLEINEKKKILKQALMQLKEDDAFVLILYYYKELSVEEISQTTGLSASNVKVKLHRGRKQMQLVLSKLLKEELNTFV